MGVIFTIVGALGLSLIGREIWCYQPRLQEWLLRIAVRQLPVELRDRYREEWAALIAEFPGELTRTTIAASQVRSAIAIANATEEFQTSRVGVLMRRLFDIIFVAPCLLVLTPAFLIPKLPGFAQRFKVSSVEYIGRHSNRYQLFVLHNGEMVVQKHSVWAVLALLLGMANAYKSVFLGRMSIVGPAPRTLDELENLGRAKAAYLQLRPGIASPTARLRAGFSIGSDLPEDLYQAEREYLMGQTSLGDLRIFLAVATLPVNQFGKWLLGILTRAVQRSSH